MLRIGVLGSTRGTNLLSLFNVIDAGNLTAEVAVVVSNKSEALILEKARERGVVAEFVCSKGLDRVEYDLQISALLETHKVDLVVLIGYMRILSSQFVDFWQGRIINVHPSLLPAFAGLMDLAVHQAVLDAGVKETGCTVHYVTEEVDAGPIIVQKTCPVFERDDAASVKARVQELEGCALVEAVRTLTSNC